MCIEQIPPTQLTRMEWFFFEQLTKLPYQFYTTEDNWMRWHNQIPTIAVSNEGQSEGRSVNYQCSLVSCTIHRKFSYTRQLLSAVNNCVLTFYRNYHLCYKILLFIVLRVISFYRLCIKRELLLNYQSGFDFTSDFSLFYFNSFLFSRAESVT